MTRIMTGLILVLTLVAALLTSCENDTPQSTPDAADTSPSETNQASNVPFEKLVQEDRAGFYDPADEQIVIKTQDALSNLNTTHNVDIRDIDFDKYMLVGIGKNCSYSASSFSIDAMKLDGGRLIVTVSYQQSAQVPDLIPSSGYSLSIVKCETMSNQIVFEFVQRN